MNAKQVKDCMRLYLVETYETDGFKNLRQFVHELEDEAGDTEVNKF